MLWSHINGQADPPDEFTTIYTCTQSPQLLCISRFTTTATQDKLETTTTTTFDMITKSEGDNNKNVNSQLTELDA